MEEQFYEHLPPPRVIYRPEIQDCAHVGLHEQGDVPKASGPQVAVVVEGLGLGG